MALLGASILSTVTGYVFGFRFGSGAADGVEPRRFVADLAKRRDEAMIGAIEQIVSACGINLDIRFVKRALAVTSVILLLAGLVLVLLARPNGGVLH